MSTYTNPDAPNPEITDAAVRSMLMQGQQQNGYTPNSGYYPGGYANPFTGSQNVTSVPSADSRANIGYPISQTGVPAQYQYSPMQTGIAPAWNPGTASFNQLSQMNAQALAGQSFAQPTMGYSGYPLGVDPTNYIFEYMKNNSAPKNTWGENYWTQQKPIDPPPIDWTAKPQQYTDPYAQYGMTCVPQQPMLPAGFSFPPVQETWLDQAKRNWKHL